MILDRIVDNIYLLTLFIILAIILFIFFYWPWLFGAPFEPTKEKKLKKMIEFAGIKKRKGKRRVKAVDLGSGDGRLVIALAKAGAEAHGYEINPFLVWISRRNIKNAGLKGKAFIHWGSFWNVNLKEYNIVILFQFPTIMKRLKKKLMRELEKGTKVISNHWRFPSWKIRKKSEDVLLYVK